MSRSDDVLRGGEMGGLMREMDWATTSVGAPDTWPQSLRTAVSILLESRFPMYIAWGPTYVQFYNDGYRPILGATKHPAAMGGRAAETFAESWHIIGPMFDGVRAGTAVGAEDWMLPLDRNGYLEECYFTFSYSPIRDETGDVGGVNVTVTETTGRVVGERRLRTLRNLAAHAGAAQSVEAAWRGAARAIEDDAFDLPFAVLYQLEDGAGQPALVAATPGISTIVESWPFPESTYGEALVTDVRARFGDLPGGAWPEPPETALVLPIARAGSERPHGFLVAGLSTRRSLDDDYRGFLRLVAAQIAVALGNARAYEDEKRRAEALAEIDRAKTAFFSNVSHEFRTPLTLMLGPIEDGLADTESPLPPIQRERQELVRRNGLRLQKLVNTLLDFARIEASRAQVAFVPTDLAALTADLASSFDSAFATAGLGFEVDCPPLPEPIHVDPALWEKVVLNLLSNALKFTFKGAIVVSVRWKGDHAELRVSDTGIGIPEHELPRIFDRFHRVEGARGRSHEGSGIGLALVRELVTLHEGSVEVESRLGYGTTFVVRLPAGAAHVGRAVAGARTLAPTGIGPAAFLAEITQWNDAGAVPAIATAPEVNTGARILVADDNADMRGYLTRLLSRHWRVEVASSGDEALAAARANPPDLVLSDVMMPGLDGLGLVRQLRADERTQTIPIVLLSARAGEEATVDGLNTGADAYVTKPFSANELVARVDAQLAVAKLRQQAVQTERADADKTRRLLVAEEQAKRAREEILAVVSHDLRSPLGTIRMAAELLERSVGEDARARRQTDMIRRSVDKMNGLLGDLLDLASIDSQTLSLDRTPHTADELLRDNHEAFEASAAAKQVAFETVFAPDVPALECDKERVLQTLGNVVANAIKFTPAGGLVKVSAGLDGAAVKFTVTDTGPGITAAARPHVFDRYWHARQNNRQGHGLGLSIAKGIVESHGGQIGVDSTSGGSTFWFTIPTKPAAARSHDVRDGFYATGPGDDDSFVQGGGECGALIRAFDWSTTCLGPMASWPQSTRTSVSTMLRSPYPITMFWGRDLAMLYNDAFRPIHGEKHPGTIGASAPQALAEAWSVLGPLVAKTLESGEPLFVENGAVFFARRPGGLREETYFTWSYNPTIGETGGIAGLFAIASETTRQVIGERRLATLRELSLRTAYDRRVESIFRSVEEVLAQADADLPFALLYVVEHGRPRLVSCIRLTRGGMAAPIEPPLDDAGAWPLATVVHSQQEVMLEHLDAKLGPFPGGRWPEPATRALVLPVPIADAETTGVLVAGLSPLLPLDDEYRSFLELLARQVSASISSARAHEQETERAEKLAELDRAKTDFFSNVSHEFRTPLTLILGPVEDALATASRSLAGDRLELVRRNALRLYKMVNTLLDFSRMEAGRAQATFVPTELAAFTKNVASQFQSAVERAGLEFVIESRPLPEAIYVDPELWEKVVLNLISNALKYTHRGRIRVELGWDGGQAVLAVQDTGVGIAPDEIDRVFERFFRAQVTHGRSHEGTGIGLALVRELVRLHGGTVAVESVLGEGSTFTVRIPPGSAHLPSDRIERTARPRSTAAGAAPFVEEALRWSADAPDEDVPGPDVEETQVLPPAVRAARILFVDDNADLRTYVAGLLGRIFAQIETATNGRDALDRARRTPPDVIVSDVMMPVMDGFELVRELRSDVRTRAIPIILLSARAGDDSTVVGLESGADDYLVKPFSGRELVARVRGQLEMSGMRAEVWRERAKREELHRSVAMRDEFISVTSHELRTPLTALQLQIEGLIERPVAELPPKVASKLDTAQRQIDRLVRLTESLLAVSRVALGRLELHREDLDLSELVGSVVARHAAEARGSGSTFVVKTEPVRGRWERASLEIIIGHLLSNALKFAPGTKIEVAVARTPDAATISVRDEGPGIRPEDLGRIFDRFERAVSSAHHGGLGVGLYLVRTLAEAHGGSVAARSESGHGAMFVVTLPLSEGS